MTFISSTSSLVPSSALHHFWSPQGNDLHQLYIISGPLSASSEGVVAPPPRRELQENQDINKENNSGEGGPPCEDSISALVRQGYSRERVIDALRVSRNNLKMAEDILRTFVKQSQ
ncbi:hypothetical protein ACOMHN_044552 [Nucella lapillus]